MAAQTHNGNGNLQQLLQILLIYHLPIALAIAIAIALSVPSAGAAVAEYQLAGSTILSTVLVICIFLLSGLGLKEEDVHAALRAFSGLIAAIVVILGISPCFGFLFTALPWASSPELGIGLAVFAAVPTTLSSGVALTQQARGNAALALSITACTNIAGVATSPAFLSVTLRQAGARVDVVALLIRLAITLVAPLLIGKLLRFSTAVKNFADKHKRYLTIASSLFLVVIVWQELSASATEVYALTAAQVFAVLAAGLAFHGVLLALTWALAVPILRLQEAEARAVFLLGSQKTLPGSAVIISFLDREEVGELGLVLVPCILAHIVQLFLDSAFATRLSTDALMLTRKKRGPIEDATHATVLADQAVEEDNAGTSANEGEYKANDPATPE